MNHHPGNARLIAIFGVFAVVTIILLWWSIALVPNNINRLKNIPQACTDEAKLCPDGSAVGRTGPNCEFANCPVTNVNNGATNSAANGCIVTGCGGTVCSDQQAITDCLARPTDSCYDSALCERQASGVCGWTLTAKLQSCLVQGGLSNTNK